MKFVNFLKGRLFFNILLFLYVYKQTFCNLYGEITWEFFRFRVGNFQGIIFLWKRTYREIFKSALVYLQTGKELLFKYEHFFFSKNGNLIINWVLSLFYKHSLLVRLSSQSNKMKSLGLQKSQFLNSLVNWEKSGSAT